MCVCFFSVSDALLADLQNSVPGSQKNSLNQYSGQNGSATSGYGSLRPKPPPQSVCTNSSSYRLH